MYVIRLGRQLGSSRFIRCRWFRSNKFLHQHIYSFLFDFVRVSLRPPPTFNHSQQCLIEMHVSLIVIDSEINFALEQNCVQLNFVLRAGVH